MTSSNLLKRLFRYVDRTIHSWIKPEAQALRQLRRTIGPVPRHQPGQVKVWGWDLEFVDAASCISAFDYIVLRRWNDFVTSNPQPCILDCGANIGISVLHYKRLFPNAKIVAFEPDPEICRVLRRNLRVNNAADVQVVEAALWDTEGEMLFEPDGADGGRLAASGSIKTRQQVKTQRLVKYLDEAVDLLKMDIEGAETRVMSDCDSHLSTVNRLIIEYHSISKRPKDLSLILSILEKNRFGYYINSDGAWLDFLHPPIAREGWLEQFLMIYAERDGRL